MVVAEQLLITRLVTAARNIFWASTSPVFGEPRQ